MEGEEPNAKRPHLDKQEHDQLLECFSGGTSETVSSSSEPVPSSVSSVCSTSGNVNLPSTSVPLMYSPSPSSTSAPAAPVMETACVSSSVAVATIADLSPIGQLTSSYDSKPHQMGLQSHSNSTINYPAFKSLDCADNEVSLLAVNSGVVAFESAAFTSAASSSTSTVLSMPTQASAVFPRHNSTHLIACTASQSSNVSSSPVTACDTSTLPPIVQVSSTPVRECEVSLTPPIMRKSSAPPANKITLPVPAIGSSPNAPNQEFTASGNHSSTTVCEVSSTPAAADECAFLPTSFGAVSSTAASGSRVSSATEGRVSSSASARLVPVSAEVSSSLSAKSQSLVPPTVTEEQLSSHVNSSESNISSSSVLLLSSNATQNVLSSATDASSSSFLSRSSQSSTGTAAVAEIKCPNPESLAEQKTVLHLEKNVKLASSQASDKVASVFQISEVQSSALSSKTNIKEIKLGNSSTSSKSSTDFGHLKAPLNSDEGKPVMKSYSKKHPESVVTLPDSSAPASLLASDIQNASTMKSSVDKSKTVIAPIKSHSTKMPSFTAVLDSILSSDSSCKENQSSSKIDSSNTSLSGSLGQTSVEKSEQPRSPINTFTTEIDLNPFPEAVKVNKPLASSLDALLESSKTDESISTPKVQLSAVGIMSSPDCEEFASLDNIPVTLDTCSPLLPSSPKTERGSISIVSVSLPKAEVEKVSSIIISEDKIDGEEVSTKSLEVECMEVDTEPDLGKALVSTGVSKKMETKDALHEIDTASMNVEAKLIKKSILNSQVSDNSIFFDDESFEAILRKPEPVTNIREETLAGDPRLDAPEITSGVSPLHGSVDESSMDMSKTLIASEASLGAKDEDNDESAEDEEEEVLTKKTPKKRKKPRRSVFSRKRTEKKKKEKENETDGVPSASEGDAVPMDQEGVTLASLPAAPSPVANMDEDSQGSGSNKEKKEVRRFRCEVVVPESTEAFTVEKVMEYVWPLEGGYGEHYFVQEHISQYIGISSFKRKYPDLRRRPIDMAERDYLKELGMVSEIACDMGLMAVRSEDVMDVLFADFPTKFEELTHIMAERRDRQLKERGKVEYQVADIDKSKLQEYGRRAAEEAARYNAALNREKKEERRYSFDLQSFTLHMPLGLGKKLPPSLTRVGHYPVAVLPGQYTDQYKRYSTTELRRLPLNSVCSGPLPGDTAPEEPVPPPDDSATHAANAALDSKAAVAAIKTPVEEAPAADEKVLKCKVCSRGKENNRSGKAEGLIVCAKCSSASHASCVDLNPTMIPRINSYGWQCMECKNCMQCSSSEDEDKMIFCDLCDRGYHIYCVGLKRVPHGRWHCKECAVCNTCGFRSPNGGENIKNAEWQHEFRKNRDNNKIAYATTLCVPCDRLWKRRQFCYVCLKVYRSIPEDNMIRCANCPKYIHKESGECSAVFEGEHLCIPCFKSSNTTVLNHNRIIAAAKKKMASGY